MDFNVSYDKYWAYIGIPYFFIVLFFGVYVLFALDTTQLMGRDKLLAVFNSLRKERRKPPTPGGNAENAPHSELGGL